MAIQTLYPDIKPTLNLDFANTEKLDPRITFTRASAARYYDGKTVAKAEENLVLQSQTFDNASWVKNAVSVTANTIAAPDGTSTADTITEDIANSAHRIQSNAISWVSGQTYAISFFAKNGDANYVQFSGGASLGTGVFANFDIATGVTGSSSGVTSSIVSIGSGWYRCIVVVTAATSTAQDFSIGLADSASLARLAAYVGTSRFAYLWGAQVEQRSTATAYTPTTTQPITNYIPVLLTATDNVARFDHNPTTSESLGLLVEEQRTNLVTYSEDFANAAWNKTRSSITSNTIVAPDGALTGDKLVENTDNNTHLTNQTSISLSAVPYTFSVYLKAAERSWARMTLLDGVSTFGAYFNLGSGVVGEISASTTASITSVGNGWYRCTITATTASGSGIARITLASGDGSQSYQGDGYSGVFIWGAQLESGSFGTSYIPTVASQVTRSADAASMTGANFSSWYRADEGTLYGEVASSAITVGGASRRIANITNGTENNRITIAWAGLTGVGAAFVTDQGVTQAGFNSPSGAYPFPTKVALAYKTNDFQASVNNSTFTADTSGTVPTVNQLTIGDVVTGSVGAQNINGTIRRLAFYPKALPANLVALTG